MARLSRRAALATLALAALGGTSGRLRADEVAAFPRRPVRLVVPYGVGVGPDVVARALADRLARRWGQPVLVDNKPGASGIVAFGDVRRTAPDGHTLYLADTATLVVNPLLHQQLPYDVERDLLPLTLLFRATFVLWVGHANRFQDLAGLLAAARRQPGSVSYATLGHGHASHVAVETLARAAGVELLAVPFKDVGALLMAVSSAEVDFTTIGINTVAGLHARGHLRPLAVAAEQRLASHPDIPTLAEAGGPALTMHPWAALVALAGTPAPVLRQLQHDLMAELQAPALNQAAQTAGFELTPSSPQALRDRISGDLAAYAPLVREDRIARL